MAGVQMPIVATIAPGNPAIKVPTKVDTLMAKGPGAIPSKAIISAYS